jgi:hypothetical protein
VIDGVVSPDSVFDEEQSQNHHDGTRTNQKMQEYFGNSQRDAMSTPGTTP